MADYIDVTESQSDPFAPLTSELTKQLRDNPIAMAEGQPGAPRFAYRARRFTDSSGAISYLSGYQGCRILGYFDIGSNPGATFEIQFSNDGTTWPDGIEISVSGGYEVWVDFATGDWFFTSVTAATSSSGTMALMPTDPTHIRIQPISAPSTAVTNIWLNGGASAS